MQINKRINKKGFALVIVLSFVGLFLAMAVGVIAFVNNEIGLTKQQIDSTKAFFLAESGIERAIAAVRDAGDVSTVPSSVTLANLASVDNADLDNINIGIASSALGGSVYQIIATVTFENSTRTITANLMTYPPSGVFDYAYFINNWGWFWGRGITANGDVRSNGNFEFRQDPLVDGEVYAGQDIGGGDQVRGLAGTEEDGEFIYQHADSPVVEMPNLQDLSYYEDLATSGGSTLTIAGATVIDGVYGDDAGETGNIVLIGTPSNPITIDGPIVATGDIIVSGTVSGQGTIYAGRNIYIADDINYKNAPSSPRPSSNDPEVINQWVAAHQDSDIVGFAASENIILGDYTGSTGGAWYANWWLFSMGSEDVGEDGIPDTGDTGEGDGTFQPDYEDLDGDGIFDDDYTWADIQTQVDIEDFTNVPDDVDSFGDIATNNVNRFDGVYYTNHACAGRVGNAARFNGSIISKDETIVYRNNITLNYDERINSRYRSDPNWLIDLQLPFANRVGVVGWWEG